MTKFADEQLSAFLDSAAEPGLAAEIEKAIGTDQEVLVRLGAMRRNDQTLRAVFDAALGPNTIELPSPQDGADIAPFSPRRRMMPSWQMAAALLLALATGWIAGTLLHPTVPSTTQIALLDLRQNGLVVHSDLARALSAARSGVAVQTATGALNVKLSFRSVDGSLCRQFELSSLQQSAEGVACRSTDAWHISGWVSNKARASGGYQTAAGTDDARMRSILDDIGVAHELDRADEDAAIRSDWKSKTH